MREIIHERAQLGGIRDLFKLNLPKSIPLKRDDEGRSWEARISEGTRELAIRIHYLSSTPVMQVELRHRLPKSIFGRIAYRLRRKSIAEKSGHIITSVMHSLTRQGTREHLNTVLDFSGTSPTGAQLVHPHDVSPNESLEALLNAHLAAVLPRLRIPETASAMEREKMEALIGKFRKRFPETPGEKEK
ncbi:MAG: hypothetical protein ABH863_01465 [Candidatus Micrarchaeota archaeon]